MSSVQHLRDFISQRLTAAAEEIFTVFQRTVVRYEEELERQRRLLDVTWKPDVPLERTEPPHHLLSKDEEDVPADQQLWNQEGKSSSDQEEPEPSQIKEEGEDLFFSQDEEQLVLEQDASMATPDLSISGAEPNRNRSDPAGSWTEDSEPRNPELKLKKKQNRSRFQTGFWSCQDQDRPDPNPESDYFLTPGHEDRDPNSRGSGTEEPKPPERRVGLRTGSNFVVQGELSPVGCPRPVSCDVCGKTFRCNSEMKVHYRVHTGEKPFSCQICQRAFSFKVNLSVHMRTHTGEKPYSCDFCQKRFSDHSSLRKHTYVHTGERPYSCAVCGKRFSRSSHRWRHVRLHAAQTLAP